jgi:preprotein translocase subunit SecE
MATKAAIVNGKMATKKPQVGRGCLGKFRQAVGNGKDFTRFLSDVRAEMRKVVTPSRKEVEATTTVVIIAVFIFGLFFFVVDCDLRHRPAPVAEASWADCSSKCSRETRA